MSESGSDKCKTETKINLTLLNGTGFTFNTDDYMKIRKEYRVVGKPIGACSALGHDPQAFGLPIQYSEHETKLLLEKGYARLLDKSSLAEPPSEETKKLYQEYVEKIRKEQEGIMREGHMKNAKDHVEQIIAGKKRKLAKTKNCSLDDIEITEEQVLKEIADNYKFNPKDALEEIPYEHPFPHTVIEVKDFRVHDDFHYKVFKDLYEQGKHVTSGELFGGDFIAYPGDPMLYHASHIITITKDGNVSPLEIVAKARLAVSVNKICVFAFPDSEDNVQYQTFKWADGKTEARQEKEKLSSSPLVPQPETSSGLNDSTPPLVPVSEEHCTEKPENS